MGTKKTEAASVDIFIEEVLSEDKKATIKSMLMIPYTPNKTNKAFRVFTKENDQKFYASVRVGTLQKTEEGYECNVTGFEADLLGNRFELTDVGTKEIVMRGKIANKKAATSVVDFQKTGTGK